MFQWDLIVRPFCCLQVQPLTELQPPAPTLPSMQTYFFHRLINSYSVIGAANALFTAGAACGAIAQGFVADWLGRKKGMAVAAVLTAIGGALSTGSVNMAMIITVRIIQGIGAGMTICLVPLYLAETAPPQRRGFLSGLTVFAFGCGYET